MGQRHSHSPLQSSILYTKSINFNETFIILIAKFIILMKNLDTSRNDDTLAAGM